MGVWHGFPRHYRSAMKPDLGALYRASRLRIVDLVSDDVSSHAVPATPLWTVHDVIAHLAGITEDVATGNMSGVTTDPWTAAQVERGRHRSMGDLLAMWDQHAPMIESFLSSPDGASAYQAVLDVHTHEADLLNALGRPVDLPGDALAWLASVLRSEFDAAVAASELPPVTVEASNMEWFRGRLGRRTETEVLSLSWSRDPGPYLGHWFVFGRAEVSLGER